MDIRLIFMAGLVVVSCPVFFFLGWKLGRIYLQEDFDRKAKEEVVVPKTPEQIVEDAVELLSREETIQESKVSKIYDSKDL